MQNFFLNAIDELARTPTAVDHEATNVLLSALAYAQKATEDALSDSFDTRIVMEEISKLITSYNSATNGTLATDLVSNIARWVTMIVNVFGLNGNAPPDGQSIGWSGVDIDDATKPFVSSISTLRDKLRDQALSQDGHSAETTRTIVESVPNVTLGDDPGATAPYRKILRDFKCDTLALAESENKKDILALCDRIRDIDLWDRGVYLEDRESQPALIRPVTRAQQVFRQEAEERLRKKQLERQERENKDAAKAAAKADQARISHRDMFKTEENKKEFTEWTEDGIPTHDFEGKPLAKNKRKKLEKEWEKQKKLHENWLASSAPTNSQPP